MTILAFADFFTGEWTSNLVIPEGKYVRRVAVNKNKKQIRCVVLSDRGVELASIPMNFSIALLPQSSTIQDVQADRRIVMASDQVQELPPPVPPPLARRYDRTENTVRAALSAADRTAQEAVYAPASPASRPPMTHCPITSLIDRTNHFLATSPPTAVDARNALINELEYHLLMTGNLEGYQYLDPAALDPTRRRYNIPNRLAMHRLMYAPQT